MCRVVTTSSTPCCHLTWWRVSRVSVSHDESRRKWSLHIAEAQLEDTGPYMCQLNTDPMKSRMGYLDVIITPDIVDIRDGGGHLTDTHTNIIERNSDVDLQERLFVRQIIFKIYNEHKIA